jgi:hypothetical protein
VRADVLPVDRPDAWPYQSAWTIVPLCSVTILAFASGAHALGLSGPGTREQMAALLAHAN